MKKYLRKAITLFIAIILLSFLCSFFQVYGSSPDNSPTTTATFDEESSVSTTNSFVDLLTGGVLYIGQLIEEVLSKVVGQGLGNVSPSIDAIVFNEYPITRIDYFRKNVTINDDLGIKLKNAVSVVYSIEVATIISIFIFFLVYIGMKIILSSIADEKAKYKENLTSWIIGVLMLLSFHFIMGYIIEINDSLIGFARNIVTKSSSTGTMVLQDLVSQLKTEAYMAVNIVKAIIWLLLLLKTLVILFKYLKRLVTITILIILFPFVTLGYVFDKIKGGKSRIFDIWSTAFLQNVFINFIDAVIYLILVQVVLDTTMNTILIPFIAIMIFDTISNEIAKLVGINKNEYLSPVNTMSNIYNNNKGVIKSLKENIKKINQKEEKNKNVFEINALNSLGRYNSKTNNLVISKENEIKDIENFNAAKKSKSNSKINLKVTDKSESREVNVKVEEILKEKIDKNADKFIKGNVAEKVDINSNELNNAKVSTYYSNKKISDSAPKIEISDMLPQINIHVNTKVDIDMKDLKVLKTLNSNSESLNNVKPENKNEEIQPTYEKDENEKYSIDNVLKKAGINPESLTQEEKIEIYKEQISSYKEVQKEAKIEMKKKQKFNKKA